MATAQAAKRKVSFSTLPVRARKAAFAKLQKAGKLWHVNSKSGKRVKGTVAGGSRTVTQHISKLKKKMGASFDRNSPDVRNSIAKFQLQKRAMNK